MHVDQKELEHHLSEYLDRVANGEVVVVTDRGVPKVVMDAAPGVDQFADGVAAGWIPSPKRTYGLGPPVRQDSSERVVDVLLGDRGE